MDKISVYMDACCLNRPFDDHAQNRVYLESEAVLSILASCQDGRFDLVYSDIIEAELLGLTNEIKLKRIHKLHSIAVRTLRAVSEIYHLAESFQSKGIKLMDSLHLATAEHYGVDVLFTTDDRFEKRVQALHVKTRVVNPVIWLMEVMRDER